MIDIDLGKCTGCGLCVAACPFDALSVSGKKASASDKCTLCGICAPACKFGAISAARPEASGKSDVSAYSGVWVFAELKADGSPAAVDYELLGAARALAGELGSPVSSVLICGGAAAPASVAGMGANAAVATATATATGASVATNAAVATATGASVAAAVAAGAGASVAAAAAKELIAHGADNVFIAEHPSFSRFNDELWADAFAQLVSRFLPEIILIGATTYGRSLAPRLSSRLNTGLT
ncbi:MAG: 4Fe-4S binding protein, partial [Clostridiales bacterium]|nr:4Fe-4S binding protein [Clostridiales bacterium]